MLSPNNSTILNRKLRVHLAIEGIPHTPNGFNPFVFIQFFLAQLFTECADMHHDGIAPAIISFTPYLLEYILGTEDFPRVAGQKIQNIKLLGRQLNVFAI
ncbi:hypothetical protein D3C76_1545340 [compost metagenome]